MGAPTILGAASLGMSGASAISGMSASGRSAKEAAAQEAAIKAAEFRSQRLQLGQTVIAAEDQRQQRVAESELIRSRIRAAAGESGIGFGGTFAALDLQAAYDAQQDIGRVEANLSNQISAILNSGTIFPESPANPFAGAISSVFGALPSALAIPRSGETR